jgi:hypothetical protein
LPFARRRVSKPARCDITWWSPFLLEWNSIHLFSPQHPTVHIYTDTSSTKGLGSHFQSDWFAVRCSHCHRNHHIQVKEMLAVVYAVLCWGERLSGMHIVFHVNNEAILKASPVS